ncbi:hypothetical protein P691DRAFT_440799 [Macrolepiota fuliginosa MF-IS2]|uniref:Uncharacterized protein n=1 Tax=Macrolepiota fuliginosa MF-IS2 TaxID=1400762 RepID=A0A9P6C3H7_9AGAR|nr:hypothetical protein P691DRAFT_440799 [Macrolepiota fuliginosa MF-IS2]
MTEYDYSPQARERYIEKQLAIARWVDETNHYPPANPFLSSEAPGTSDSVQRPDFASPDYNPDSDSYFGHYSSRDRRRSGDDSHHRRRSNHGSPRTSHSARRHLRSSSSPPSPHTSYPRAAPTSNQYPYLYAPGYAQPQHSQDRYPSNAATITPPMSSPQPYTPYGRSSPNQPILIPMNGREGGYYLVQPRGVTYQVVVSLLPFRYSLLLLRSLV